GDLVNRGPRSLEVLRWVRQMDERLGERLRVVLGNHDLHLLAFYDGYATPHRKDTLDEVLGASDAGELVAWVARRPLIVHQGDFVLVHAGLLPQWTVEIAAEQARDLEPLLRDPARRRPLLDRSPEARQDPQWAARRAALKVFTGLRTCTVEGEPCKFKGPPESAPPGCLPWFEVPGRRSAEQTVVFGHWAAMGLRIEPTALALDSGVVWGHRLSALRLEDRALWQQPTLDSPLP
ncbi:MAG: symmetrical bis(5'-nucleosyl)-tetraphosphatase, partial [Acidobacteriota bacterium]